MPFAFGLILFSIIYHIVTSYGDWQFFVTIFLYEVILNRSIFSSELILGLPEVKQKIMKLIWGDWYCCRFLCGLGVCDEFIEIYHKIYVEIPVEGSTVTFWMFKEVFKGISANFLLKKSIKFSQKSPLINYTSKVDSFKEFLVKKDQLETLVEKKRKIWYQRHWWLLFWSKNQLNKRPHCILHYQNLSTFFSTAKTARKTRLLFKEISIRRRIK